MGPTAAGKTDLAVDWVQRFPCDIISVDSALIYRGMDIGTAKPDAATLAIAPHRLIDILDPADAYSAADFCIAANQEIAAIHAQQRIPLLVGGTMLYFRALQQGLSALPKSDPQLRLLLQQQLEQEGLASLYAELEKIDPQTAARLYATDTQRILRALEVYRLSGKPLSNLQQGPQAAQHNFINIGIVPADRALLHQRIAHRFNQMLKNGFIEEVTHLKNRGDLHANLPSMRAVGYRQIWEYLAGQITYQQMCDQAIIATRQLAKRQMTWLRSWPELTLWQETSLSWLQTLLFSALYQG
jgi:tRNA dimethylallyltransferase